MQGARGSWGAALDWVRDPFPVAPDAPFSIKKRGGDLLMDVNGIVQLISQAGFPIAVVIYLFYYQKDTLDKLANIIHENTQVIQSLQQEIHEHWTDRKGAA